MFTIECYVRALRACNLMREREREKEREREIYTDGIVSTVIVTFPFYILFFLHYS